jgi:uncharacterized protein YkwD
MTLSCEKDEDFLRITAFENELHEAVNNYRTSNGLNELAHNFDILSREAKAHAQGRASGNISESQVQDDMEERWATVWDKLGINNVSNESYISAEIQDPITVDNASQIAAAVVDLWASDTIGEIILKGDYTIHGPGEGKTSDGRTYIMHMFCKFEQ